MVHPLASVTAPGPAACSRNTASRSTSARRSPRWRPPTRAACHCPRGAHRPAERTRGLLVLDEPTVFLPREGVERLFALVRSVAAEGTSVLFVSHDIDEVRELTIACHRAPRRRGRWHRCHRPGTDEELVTMIVGQAAREAPGQLRAHDAQGPVAAPGQGRGHHAPCEGSTSRCMKARFSVSPASTDLATSTLPTPCSVPWRDARGHVRFQGQRFDLESFEPTQAVSCGMAFVPGDRKREGAAADLSVGENITMQSIDHLPALAAETRCLAQERGRPDRCLRRPAAQSGCRVRLAERRQPAKGADGQVAEHEPVLSCCCTSLRKVSTSAPESRSSSPQCGT